MTTTTDAPAALERHLADQPPRFLADTPAGPLVEDLVALQRRHRQALADWETVTRDGGAQARKADTAAAAEALRSGEPDPGTPAETDYQARVATARRNCDVLATAVAQAHQQLVTAIHSPPFDDWLAKHRTEMATAHTKTRKALADLRGAIAQLDHGAGVAAWAYTRELRPIPTDIFVIELLAADAHGPGVTMWARNVIDVLEAEVTRAVTELP